MQCPKCLEGRLRVSHTHSAGPGRQAQRRQCDKCLMTFTTVCTILHTDPDYGQGAAIVARQMKVGAPAPLTDNLPDEPALLPPRHQ